MNDIPRYSPIAPIHLLEQLHEVDCLSGYLLLLAHDVLRLRGRYSRFIAELREKHDDLFIIMDNSVVELGKAMDLTLVIQAATDVNADCIATPDVIGDFPATQRLLEVNRNQILSSGFAPMFIPQGMTPEELKACVNWIQARFDCPHYWGIPRWVANHFDSRRYIINYINHVDPQEHNIHLLGMSNHFNDDIECVSMPNVLGIDSANPLVSGHYGIDMRDNYSEEQELKHLERGAYWSEAMLTPLIQSNVEFVRHMVEESDPFDVI